MKLSYIKGASDPLGEAGNPYTGYDCSPPAADDLRLGSAALHEVKPAIAAKQSTGNAAEGSPATAVGTLDERLYATHDALGNCTAILNTSGAV